MRTAKICDFTGISPFWCWTECCHWLQKRCVTDVFYKCCLLLVTTLMVLLHRAQQWRTSHWKENDSNWVKSKKHNGNGLKKLMSKKKRMKTVEKGWKMNENSGKWMEYKSKLILLLGHIVIDHWSTFPKPHSKFKSVAVNMFCIVLAWYGPLYGLMKIQQTEWKERTCHYGPWSNVLEAIDDSFQVDQFNKH